MVSRIPIVGLFGCRGTARDFGHLHALGLHGWRLKKEADFFARATEADLTHRVRSWRGQHPDRWSTSNCFISPDGQLVVDQQKEVGPEVRLKV